MEFYQRIKFLRNKFNLTQEQLGKEIGISKVSVWQWENGINYPKQEIAQKLCDYFNVSLDYLMGRTDNPRPISPVNSSESDDYLIAFSELGDYRELDEQQKEMIRTMIKTFKDQNAKK